MQPSLQLIGKVFFRGEIELVTGLHIGGSKNSLDIGGIDLSVVKTPLGIPFIPGSSLKGKLRSLLAQTEGSQSTEQDSPNLKTLFGYPGKGETERGTAARLIVRDAHLVQNHFREAFPDLDPEWTEIKWENTINRMTGTALNPRQLERVPAGARFSYELVYNRFSDNYDSHKSLILQALRLLEDDYLGGQGSRGYGKVRFHHQPIEERSIENYSTNHSSATEHPQSVEE